MVVHPLWRVRARDAVLMAGLCAAVCGWSQEVRAEIDVVDYDLSLDVDEQAGSVSAVARVTLIGDGAPQIELDFVGYQIDALSVDGQAVDFERGEQGRLSVAVEVDEGQEAVVEVRYQGQPEVYTEPWGTWGLVFEDDRVFTLNVIEGARYWFPSHDVLRDRAAVTLAVTAREDWVVAAPGAQTEVVEVGPGRKRTVWRADWPLPTYQIHFAVAPYEVIEDEHGGVPFVYFLMPETNRDTALDTLSHAPTSLALMVDLYGPYPYPKVGFDEIDLGGAVEQPSCVSIGGQLLNSPNTFEEVIAHEMAHAWFQGVVVIEDWDDLWLSEGLATYHEAIYHAHLNAEDPDALGDYASSLALGYRSVAEAGEGVFSVHDPDVLFGVTTYRKGAMVFHALRYLLGEAGFSALLATYLERFEFGSASTEDFEALCTEIAQRDMGPFFEQWVYGAGWPQYRLGWQAAPVPEGKFQVDVSLRQVQEVGGPFTTPVELEFVGQEGAARVTFKPDDAESWQSFEVDFEPTEVVLDPDRWLLKEVDDEDYASPPDDGGDDVGMPDAGPMPDAMDDAVDDPMDAGMEVEDEPAPVAPGLKNDDGGCGCAVASRTTPWGPVGGAALALLLGIFTSARVRRRP